jgi:hypothetical protein
MTLLGDTESNILLDKLQNDLELYKIIEKNDKNDKNNTHKNKNYDDNTTHILKWYNMLIKKGNDNYNDAITYITSKKYKLSKIYQSYQKIQHLGGI